MGFRRAAKTDENHSQIVRALRQLGCSVQDLSAVGNGVPDLLVSCMGMTVLIEVKDGKKSPSKRKLTEHQVSWHETWQGRIFIVKNIEEAADAVNWMRDFVASREPAR